MKPTVEELRQALAEAERLRETNRDERFLAKSLLYQHARLEQLEEVRRRAERLVNLGQDEHEHAQLIRALEAARKAEERAQGESGNFGLA
jgi:hypothetical protein